jgi:hypothetical protein
MRPKLSYANVMATVAMFIALGGASYAALKLPKNSVGTRQLKKNAVNSGKVKNNSLTGSDINESSLAGVPTAANALTLDGQSADQITGTAKLRCPAGLILTAGVCFEAAEREYGNLIEAEETCSKEGRRLPMAAELSMFEKQNPTNPPSEEEWVESLSYGNSEYPIMGMIVTGVPSFAAIPEPSGTAEPYRCVVQASN